MDTLLTEIMMFRELRESIQSKEYAATVIRISRAGGLKVRGLTTGGTEGHRSEEHTSELQSLRHLVCRLLLEKKHISNLDGDDLNARHDLSASRCLLNTP